MLFDYFNQQNNLSFILLRANHPEVPTLSVNNIYFMDITDALRLCDSIYILHSNNIPDSLVLKCQLASKNRGLPFYSSCIYDSQKEIKDYLIKTTALDLICPIILILQIGESAQIERTELNLCTLLQNNNVRYTIHTNSWLSQIIKMSTQLNMKSPHNYCSASQLAIISIKKNVLELLNDPTEKIYFDSFINNIHPDYIVICCENDYNCKEQINNVFYVRFSRLIDAYVNSEYVSLQSNDRCKITLFVQNVKSDNLFIDIKNKLTLPDNVKEIL